VFLAAHIVGMVTCYKTSITATCLPMIGKFSVRCHYCGITCETVVVLVLQSITVRKRVETVAGLFQPLCCLLNVLFGDVLLAVATPSAVLQVLQQSKHKDLHVKKLYSSSKK